MSVLIALVGAIVPKFLTELIALFMARPSMVTAETHGVENDAKPSDIDDALRAGRLLDAN